MSSLKSRGTLNEKELSSSLVVMIVANLKEHDRGSTRTARNCRKVRGIQFSVERTLLLLCGRLTVRFRRLVEHIGDDL